MTRTSTTPRNSRRITSVLAAVGLAVTLPLAGGAPATALTPSDICASMTMNVYQSVNPTTGSHLLTRWSGEIDSAALRHGYTEKRGVAFKASATLKEGLVPVHRLYKNDRFVWMPKYPGSNELVNAVSRYGYVDQGVNFFASPTPLDCGVGVERFLKGSTHRASADVPYSQGLAAAGWKSEGFQYWGGRAGAGGTPPVVPPTPPAPAPAPAPAPVPAPLPSPIDTTFSIAVIPDTQQEVWADRPDGTNSRFSGRTRWLVDNTSKYDLRYAIHSGDVVNWDTPDHAQYEVASKGMKTLEDARLETSLAIGNHDTAAVGVGGSAADPTRTRQLVRDTTTFNTYFSAARNAGIEGTFEPGKVDNNFHTFSAGGAEWLVLTLELWPRTKAVAWARDVVATHPKHNVIINTHSYLNSDGSIYQGSDYGANSPQYVFDNLVKLYPNIKMVFSGHVGQAATREDTGVNGNRIFSYLGAFHSNETNPVRVLEIDTRAGTLRSAIHAPSRSTIWTQYDRASSGLVVIR
jgi:hypothetical protein